MKNATIMGLLMALLLVLGTARAAGNYGLPLTLTTLDDDLRAGGNVFFVMRMRDGKEQTIKVLYGRGVPNGTKTDHRVSPSPPYQWRDVVKVGLRTSLHPGDGMLLQPDKWKVAFALAGNGRDCERRERLQPGIACFAPLSASFTFEREQTQLLDLASTVGLCKVDFDCAAPDTDWCSPRSARCKVGTAGADVMGCVKSPAPFPVCGENETCRAAVQRCEKRCANPDADGDGEDSVACGGLDCDDHDPERSHGRTEVCDSKGKDEDCDPKTYGKRDMDGDGFDDASCWNDG